MNSLFGVAWEHILIGLLSGTVVAIFGIVRKRVLDWRIEKKYPLAGNYFTKFEDEKEGEKISQSASATLIQKGNKITGETTLLNDDRIWKIDGRITDVG